MLPAGSWVTFSDLQCVRCTVSAFCSNVIRREAFHKGEDTPFPKVQSWPFFITSFYYFPLIAKKLNWNILTVVTHWERRRGNYVSESPARTKYFTYILALDIATLWNEYYFSYLHVRKQSERLRNNFQVGSWGMAGKIPYGPYRRFTNQGSRGSCGRPPGLGNWWDPSRTAGPRLGFPW